MITEVTSDSMDKVYDKPLYSRRERRALGLQPGRYRMPSTGHAGLKRLRRTGRSAG